MHFHFVFGVLFILFRIAWWPSGGKELSAWLSACAVLHYAIFIVCTPFRFGVCGQYVEFDLIGSRSLPFYVSVNFAEMPLK